MSSSSFPSSFNKEAAFLVEREREREREILDDAIVLPPHQKDSEGREEGTRVTDGRMPASLSPQWHKKRGKEE